MGVTQGNEPMFGGLHALRQDLRRHPDRGLGDAVPLADLPPHVDPVPDVVDKDLLKLEAPLAVQAVRPGWGLVVETSARCRSRPKRPGERSRNRAETIGSTRVDGGAQLPRDRPRARGGGGCRAGRRRARRRRRMFPITERGVVVLASGTIESTRLALCRSRNRRLRPDRHEPPVARALQPHFRIPRGALAHLSAESHAGDVGAVRQGLHDPSRHRRHGEPLPPAGDRRRLRGCGHQRRGRGTRTPDVAQSRPPWTTTMSSSRCAGSANSSRATRPTTWPSPSDIDEYGVRRAFVSLGDPRESRRTPARRSRRPTTGPPGTPWTPCPTTSGRHRRDIDE